MESSRNCLQQRPLSNTIIKGGQNGVKSQLFFSSIYVRGNYKGGAKWSQVATTAMIVFVLSAL